MLGAEQLWWVLMLSAMGKHKWETQRAALESSQKPWHGMVKHQLSVEMLG